MAGRSGKSQEKGKAPSKQERGSHRKSGSGSTGTGSRRKPSR